MKLLPTQPFKNTFNMNAIEITAKITSSSALSRKTCVAFISSILGDIEEKETGLVPVNCVQKTSKAEQVTYDVFEFGIEFELEREGLSELHSVKDELHLHFYSKDGSQGVLRVRGERVVEDTDGKLVTHAVEITYRDGRQMEMCFDPKEPFQAEAVDKAA